MFYLLFSLRKKSKKTKHQEPQTIAAKSKINGFTVLLLVYL